MFLCSVCFIRYVLLNLTRVVLQFTLKPFKMHGHIQSMKQL